MNDDALSVTHPARVAGLVIRDGNFSTARFLAHELAGLGPDEITRYIFDCYWVIMDLASKACDGDEGRAAEMLLNWEPPDAVSEN